MVLNSHLWPNHLWSKSSGHVSEVKDKVPELKMMNNSVGQQTRFYGVYVIYVRTEATTKVRLDLLIDRSLNNCLHFMLLNLIGSRKEFFNRTCTYYIFFGKLFIFDKYIFWIFQNTKKKDITIKHVKFLFETSKFNTDFLYCTYPCTSIFNFMSNKHN